MIGEYIEFVKDKRVIFVGGCHNLLGKNLGAEIDAYDIVVRANGSVWIVDKYKEDYGSRTDIVYFNVQHNREMHPIPMEKLKNDGLSFACFKVLSDADYELYSKHMKVRHMRQLMKVVQKKCPTALNGLFIFEDLLRCGPKELFITGIDFFQSKKKVFEVGNYQEYLPEYLPDCIQKVGNRINVGKTEDGHNQHQNTKYIYNLWREGLIKMPDFIRDIMLEIVK